MVRLLCLLLFLPGLALAAPWGLDPATTIVVDVPWEGATVAVHFPPPTGSIDFDPENPATARATVTVSARGATTGVPIVDALVRSPDYLGTDAWPELTFRLDRLTPTSKATAEVAGRITHARRHPADRLRRAGDPLRPGRGRPRPLRGRLRPRRPRSTAPRSARPAACPRSPPCCRSTSAC